MIYLPMVNSLRPDVRILTAPSWMGGKATWTALPMVGPGLNQNGFEVLKWSRVALPAIGEATIRYRYGKLGNQIVSPSQQVNSSWDPSSNTITFPNLRGMEIRIQASPKGKGAWKTVWWGTCEYQKNQGYGGSKIPAGDMHYFCMDALYRTTKWPLDRHGVYIEGGADSGQTGLCWGHPGYNVIDSAGIIRGNLDPSLASFDPTAGYGGGNGVSGGDKLQPVYYHTWSGAGATASNTSNANGPGGNVWSDRQAVDHAMTVSRPYNEPVFLLNNTPINALPSGYSLYYDQPTGTGSTSSNPFSALPVGNAWPVGKKETAFGFLNKVCERSRGFGLTFLDFTESDPNGALTPVLRAWPQTEDDIEYYLPNPNGGSVTSGTLVKLPGAATFGSQYAMVDLIGDQRLVPGSLDISDREQNRVDYLESLGEPIQVAVTVSGLDNCNGTTSLYPNWQPSQAAAYAALDPTKRLDEGWRPVYQSYRLPHNFQGYMGDHDNFQTIPQHRVDYRCDDTGTIQAGTVADTSSLLCKVMPDIPFLEGYDYTSWPPVRRDGQTETGTPSRRPLIVLLRMEANLYWLGDQISPSSASVSIATDTIFVVCGSDTGFDNGSKRTISISADGPNAANIGNLGGTFDTAQLGITLCVELPHHVRFATTGLDFNGKAIPLANVRRRKKIFHENLHLWLASPGCIWDVNAALTESGPIPGKRQACGGSVGSPGILRDDRGALAVRHALACQWFLVPRRTISYTIRGCGFLPSFDTTSDPNAGTTAPTTTPVMYPTLGQVASKLSANGQIQGVGTPFTSITYDNEVGQTSWATDWTELDFVS